MTQQTDSQATSPGTNEFPPYIRTALDKLPGAFMYVLSCHEDCSSYASPQLAKLGYALEDRLPHIHEDDAEKFVQAMQHSRNTSQPFICQYRLYDGNGKLHWFHDEASVVCDESGAPLFFSGIMLDITDRKEMEAELNEHRYHLQQTVERRTEQLVRSMTLLESCNAALCDKLASAQKELATLRQQLAGTMFGAASNDCAETLYVQL